jgi:replicative DNA helicase
MKTEDLILNNLIYSETYTRKTFPHLKAEYFHDNVYKHIYTIMDNYISKYTVSPSIEALLIDFDNSRGLSEEQVKQAKIVFDIISVKPEKINLDYSIDITEKWCQDRAVHNAVLTSWQIISEGDKKLEKGSIPQLLSDAIGVSFDSSIGHDYINDAGQRFDSYVDEKARLPFDLEGFNIITDGGLLNKTLNIALASTGVGKSLFMCHCAAANLTMGKNVLYITMELADMGKAQVGQRIDGNILNMPMKQIQKLSKEDYLNKIDSLKNVGKLIIKQYPTGGASVNHFRHLVSELKMKNGFIPDIIYIDYLNICSSSRVKNSQANSYTIVKSIAEEIRGLAIELDLPIVTATQTTKNGHGNSDVELNDTSESWGVPQTADLLFALISTDELAENNQIMVKVLKSRYDDSTFYKKFIVGIDRSRMKLYDVAGDPQEGLVDAGTNKSDNSNTFQGWQ